MTQNRDPLRAAGRRRKARDAAAVLPAVGVVLLVTPVVSALAGPGNDDGWPDAVVYIFTVWLLLIGLAFWLSRHLASRDKD